MNKSKALGYATLPALFMLAGCVDKSYDLSDIDTTSEFKIKNLVLPVNIAPITLSDIITVGEGDEIKEIELNGKKVYAIKEGGSFSSSDIVVDKFVSPSPDIESADIKFNVQGAILPAGESVEFPFKDEIDRKVYYKAEHLDKSIESVSEIFLDGTKFVVDFTTDELLGAELTLTSIQLRLPAGLEVSYIYPSGTYDKETGLCTMTDVPLRHGEGDIEIGISSIVLTDKNSRFDAITHDLTIDAVLNIEDGKLKIKATDEAVKLPQTVKIDIDYYLDEMNISAFSGEVNYTLDNIHISPVDLGSVPDIFSQDANLVLANPQIYIQLNNPLAGYDLNYQVGMCLTTERDGAYTEFMPDEKSFRVGHDKGISGPYNFCLSPKEVTDLPSEFSGAKHVDFTTLGEVLSGNGLPDRIDITLPDTKIYSQKVENFKLGEDNKIDGVIGKWEFLAPLALASSGSDKGKVIYTKTQRGWNDEDVDAIEIEQLELTARVTSTLPVETTLSGFPIDDAGNQINGVKFEPMTIPAGVTNYPISLKLSGKVRHLDGITYQAVIEASKEEALSPQDSFSLKDIKVKVSGNYTKKL